MNKNSKHKCKISFIIPTYKQKSLPLKAIYSILSQNIDNTEIVIVEDGSNNLESQAKEFFARYSNISYKYVSLKENKGTFLARIEGVKNASFNHICFLDADDYYNTKEKFLLRSLLVKAIENDLDIIQFGFVKEYNGFFRKKVNSKEQVFNSNHDLLNMLLYKCKNYNLTFMWNKIYKKSILEKAIELYELNSISKRLTFAEDYYMQYCIFTLANKVELTNKKLYVYTKVKKFFFFKQSQEYYLKALQDVIYILYLIKQSQLILNKNNINYQVKDDINSSFIRYFKRVLKRKRFSNFSKLELEFKAYLKQQKTEETF